MKIRNKKASHEYFLLDDYIAGIQLVGTEIKSIRAGKVSFTDSFCMFVNGELFLKNLHISEHTNASYNNHEPKRDRKLLLTKKELKKLKTKITEKGFTLIPVSLFINKGGLAKVEISLARGKHTYDKRNSLREKDDNKFMNDM